MRVIAGKWKKLTLQVPSGGATRPTTDRVKESMFNLLPHQLDGHVLDLFAGSGSLGIEALSRGATNAIFVDKDGKVLRTLRENLRRLGCKDEAQVWQMDWRRAVEQWTQSGQPMSWIFLDPPYRMNLWESILEVLPIELVHGGVVCESPRSVQLPETINGLSQTKVKVYGDISVSIYRPWRQPSE